MQLCFDATRLSTGLDGAIELAATKGIPAVEYSFVPFTVGSKTKDLNSKELNFLKNVKALSAEKNVSIACLNLDYCLDLDLKDSKVNKNFGKMLDQMAKVATTVGCSKLSIQIQPHSEVDATKNWLEIVEKQINAWQEQLANDGLSLLLRLATAKEYRDKSLKYWTALEPQDWRELLAACPNLSLSFSPADCVWQGIDYLKVLSGITSGIAHIEAHDIEIIRTMLADSGMFGPLWWRYRLPGKGQVDWTQLIETLKLYGYDGYLSIFLDDEFIADDWQSLEDALDSAIKLFRPLIK